MPYTAATSFSFIPESYLLTAPYVPAHFLPQQQIVDSSNFDLETDELGQLSILRLVTNDEILIPFVELAKYDVETKDWFWFESASNLPYRFDKSTNGLGSVYPSNYSGLVLYSTPSFDRTKCCITAQFSDYKNVKREFYKYSPFLLVVNDRSYIDLSDYSTFSTGKLNKKDTTIPEFYYDFDSRLYTNQNLAGNDPKQIKLYYYKICDNTVQVKCRMASNTGSETFYTPRVNNYIVKLKGQSLKA